MNRIRFRPFLFPFLLVLLVSCAGREPLPELYPVPDVHLVSEKDKPVTLDQFHGEPAIYDFIFTRCTGTCPMMSTKLAKLTRTFDSSDNLHFVSISVDPTHDTPEVLRQYKSRYSNDPRWTLLTGDREAIVKLSVDGFKLSAASPPDAGTEMLLHSSKFVLVDSNGMIRGYYDTFVDQDLDKLVEDTRSLLR